MMKFQEVILVVATLALLGDALTPSSYFSTLDKERLRKVFSNAISKTPEDLSNLHYAILGLKLLGGSSLKSDQLCKKLKDKMEVTPISIYQAAVAGKSLGCKLQSSESANKVLKSAESSESANEYFHAILAQIALGAKLDAAAILKKVQDILKKDDSVTNLGYAFRIATELNTNHAKVMFDRIEDAIVQADEVDGKMLQFEGGLPITDLVISSAYELSMKQKKSPQISKMQASKFANYFLSRKSVQAVKGGYHLLNALNTLTSNEFHIPVAITLGDNSNVVSEASPKVQVRVTNLFGDALGKMDVIIESAMKQSDGTVIMSKSKMNPIGTDGRSYEVNMMASKPERGFYELIVNANPIKSDDRLAGTSGAVLLVKALGSAVLSGVEFGVVDADQSTVPKLQTATYPNKIFETSDADHHHKIILKFSLNDKITNEKIQAHQAFVGFFNTKSKSEIIYVAEPDSNSVYKFELDLGAKGKDFTGKSDKYEVKLMIGDAVIDNPINWHLVDINIQLQGVNPKSGLLDEFGPKPEITHLFREPEKRPPAAVPTLFTVLCLSLILIMFIGWAKIGVNISGFPFTFQALGFHLGLGSIFGLYICFWLQLNMFETLKWLVLIGIVTFLCGNSLLVKIADGRKRQQ